MSGGAPGNSGMLCYTCNKPGHLSRNCPEKKEQICYNCKKPGHISRDCPEGAKDGRRRGPSDRESILRPPVLGDETAVRINLVKGRCYRLPLREAAGLQEEKGVSLEGAESGITFDDLTGQYALSLRDIRPEFYKFIIGVKAANLQTLEKDTGCSISVPKTKREEQETGITVRGLSEQSVLDAKVRLEFIVERNRDRLPYTHFVSVPLDMASLQPKAAAFLDTLRAEHCTEASRLEKEMVQRPEKLHLTLLMLRLHNDADVAKAGACLRRCEGALRTLYTAQDKLTLRGVDCMNDDPTTVNVAYLCVDDDEGKQKLLDAADSVAKEFILDGLATSKEAEGGRLLHATIINSKWRRERTEEEEAAAAAEAAATGSWADDDPLVSKKRERVPFDMTSVFEAFGKVDLGAHKLTRMEVSTMQEKGETGYYEAVQSISFP
eukprot:Rhum_TRINITY_DN9380_c0_g1::Rhum_TRINITY_DN9380_c0_g1_i1::g.33170::m.33170/K18666/ASCC1; activating signal cointegrator complex subunit 1